MIHVTCRLTAKNRDQLRNPTLGNRVRATFTFVIDIDTAGTGGALRRTTTKRPCMLAVSRSLPGSVLSHILHHNLHWLDVPQRVIFKLCMTVYKRLHRLSTEVPRRVVCSGCACCRSPSTTFCWTRTFEFSSLQHCQTMVDVRSVSPVLTSRTHFLSISGNQHQ